MSYERQPDGRLRTSQPLPDEQFTVTVSAERYKSQSETLTLPEGILRELAVELQKGQDPKKGKPLTSSKLGIEVKPPRKPAADPPDVSAV